MNIEQIDAEIKKLEDLKETEIKRLATEEAETELNELSQKLYTYFATKTKEDILEELGEIITNMPFIVSPLGLWLDGKLSTAKPLPE